MSLEHPLSEEMRIALALKGETRCMGACEEIEANACCFFCTICENDKVACEEYETRDEIDVTACHFYREYNKFRLGEHESNRDTQKYSADTLLGLGRRECSDQRELFLRRGITARNWMVFR